MNAGKRAEEENVVGAAALLQVARYKGCVNRKSSTKILLIYQIFYFFFQTLMFQQISFLQLGDTRPQLQFHLQLKL